MADDKDKLPPGATIQIDLAQVQLVDLTPGPPSARKTPPPLPQGAPPTSLPPQPAQVGETRSMKALHVAGVALVVVVAVVAGLWVGGVFRSSNATPAASAAPSASPSVPASSVLTLPPIEVR
jgi:hypothetical protein